MSHGDASWAAFVDEVLNSVRTEVGELRTEFGPRHDRIIGEFIETRRELAENRRQITEVRRELLNAHQERDELRTQLDDAIRRIAELEGRNGFNEGIAEYLGRAFAEGTLPPELFAMLTGNTPRPPSIDRACVGDPSEGAQRVDLPQYGLVTYPTRGSDPEVTWGSLRALPLGEGTTVNDDERQAPNTPRATRN